MTKIVRTGSPLREMDMTLPWRLVSDTARVFGKPRGITLSVLDFDEDGNPTAYVGVPLTLNSALELREALDEAITHQRDEATN